MKLYSAEEADALVAAATPGPWRWRSFPGDACDAIWSGPDEGEGAACVLDLGDDEPYEARCGEVRTTADADLLAAAPDLARSVAHHAKRADEAEAEVARLRAENADLWAAVNGFLHEEPCPVCGDGPEPVRRWLHDGDRVACVCGHEGRVVGGEDFPAHLEWGEVSDG